MLDYILMKAIKLSICWEKLSRVGRVMRPNNAFACDTRRRFEGIFLQPPFLFLEAVCGECRAAPPTGGINLWWLKGPWTVHAIAIFFFSEMNRCNKI